MIWQRSGQLGMVSEPYRVGKYFLDGQVRYALFFHNDRLGWFESFEDCQEAAEKHAAGYASATNEERNSK